MPAFRASSLFVLYVFVSRMTHVNAASFARFFARDATNPSTTDFQKQNGLAAQQLNVQFTSLTASDPCKDGSISCVNNAFAQCTGGKWVLSQCPTGLSCYALPLVNSPGTSIACDTKRDALSRITGSGASGNLTGTSTKSTGSIRPGSASSIATSSIPASATSSGAPSTPTTGTTGGQTSHHGNDSGDDDCGDGDTRSTSSHRHSGDTGADDCNDDNTSGSHDQGGDSTHSTHSSDCNEDDSTGGSENNKNDEDCDDGITSSASKVTATASASHASSTGSGQTYHRQLNFITDGGKTTLAVPTQTAEPSVSTPITATTVPSSSPSETGIALSSNRGTTTSPGSGTVTLTLVSTVTVTASECRGDPTGLPSNSVTRPTSFVPGSSGFAASPCPSATNTPGNTYTSIPVSSILSASRPLGSTFTTPTASSRASLGGGGIFFTTAGGPY